jgi:A/G-specific adenine glycosylase
VAALLDWYAVHGRDLVIRGSREAYPIWVAEVMSQQTQIGRVGTALPAFLARFPDIPVLAAATTAEVLRAWGGLGYPRRAVALRDAARAMVERHSGRLPTGVAELEALPGIGPYTARAVAATAYGEPVTALDINARRVVGRVLDGATWSSVPSPGAQARADALAPTDHAADWNHALMDLGAGVCRAIPDCPSCPIRRWCTYAVGERPAAPGAMSRSAPTPFRDTNRYVRGRVLAMLRDTPTGAWVALDPKALAIDARRVARAARELAAEGLIELAERAVGTLEARLPEV